MKKFSKIFLIIISCFTLSFSVFLLNNKSIVKADSISVPSDTVFKNCDFSYSASGYTYTVMPTWWTLQRTPNENGFDILNIIIYYTNDLSPNNRQFKTYVSDNFNEVSSRVQTITVPAGNGILILRNGSAYNPNSLTSIDIIFDTTVEYGLRHINDFDTMIYSYDTSGCSYGYYSSVYDISPVLTFRFNFNSIYLPISTYTSSVNNFVAFNSSYVYQDGYDFGFEIGYSQGQQEGRDYWYNLGYNDGVNDGHIYTFRNLIGAVIDVPINSLKALLNFNFLDINVLDFFLSILTFVLILKIVGWFNGKS